MKKYIVKVELTGKETNENFCGVKVISYYGKGEHCFGTWTDRDNYGRHLLPGNKLLTPTNLRKYPIISDGYNRLCDAKKSTFFKNYTEKYWYVNHHIVEITIEDGEIVNMVTVL